MVHLLRGASRSRGTNYEQMITKALMLGCFGFGFVLFLFFFVFYFPKSNISTWRLNKVDFY